MATSNQPNYFDLENLKSKTGEGRLYNGGLQFTFNLHTQTPEELSHAETSWRDLSEDERTLAMFAYMVDHDLLTWNLSHKGQPIPLNGEEVLRLVPLSVLEDVAAEMRAQRSPSKRIGRR